ncbi:MULTISPECIES: AAA family ATPase [unclassified Solwaraspora]|uniref:AAA family ATPase n=1 Tax=unclassified Solwaraspora TaxID=2627926 RepID=UPI00259B64E6|nr:AAA family ATPase [Solwaraspora sp. WMMA2056]WJK41977.1 AAA family ATPase [Solwaraspora sp. WMMA2056]
MRRVSVVGVPGSGKSTLATALAARLGVPHVELDALFHQPDWQPTPPEEFRAAVADATAGDGWVADGNYSSVQETIWQRADTVIWYDLPRWQVMRQIVWRTVHRAWSRVELWNGNRERWTNLLSRDPEHSIVVWAWQQYPHYRSRYQAALTDPRWSHLRIVRITAHAQARRLLHDLDR